MYTLHLFLFFLTLNEALPAKILLMPGAATSHCLEMMSVGEELLKRGHEVTLYSLLMEPLKCISAFGPEQYGEKFKVVTVSAENELLKELQDVNAKISKYIFGRESLFSTLKDLLYPTVKRTCDLAFSDKDLLKRLKQEKFDLAIIEGVPFCGCFFGIPILLDIPSVALGSFIDFQDSKTPMQTNTFPNFMTEYSNEMGYIQRTLNTIFFFVYPIMKKIIMPSVDLSKYSEKLVGYDSNDLAKRSVLFIENSDYIVDYPKALFPNFVQAGALTASPAKPLPADLKKLLDGSKEGVVLVTFGSMIKEMPSDMKGKMMKTFGRLSHQVLFKQDRDEVNGNVRIMKWIPQNDVLGHPNTKLFISHCGKNGFWESVYHGVPIICMAIHAETYTTKVKVRKYGIGSSINIFDDTVDEMVQTINGVFSNDTIHKNMKRRSTLLRDRSETPRQRAASAIEHVLKYGGDHMRPPSVDFDFMTYSCVDVWLVLFLIVFVILSFDIWLLRKCCRSKKEKTKLE